MPKKKENLIDKLVKKNYKNELEAILEHKNYDENSKSILLSILYKIEAAYKDYSTVKVDVEPKDDYIQNLISIIEKDCKDIKLVSLEDEKANELLENKTFYVDKKIKRIICYPIERKLLYAIAKIGKKDKIVKDKYFIRNLTISNLINTGNNISMVEPLRDFNGYSWTTLPKEIESIAHNLVYQNLRILIGNDFLNQWTQNKEYIIDYYELFLSKLLQMYGEKSREELIDLLCQISILLEIKFNKDSKRDMTRKKKEVDKKLKEVQDRTAYIVKITKQKRKLEKQIREIDETLNNKRLLQKEYKIRNELLPLEKKIFSLRILSELMQKERKDKLNQIKQLNSLVNPQKFIKYKEDLEEKEKYLKVLDTEDVEKEINKKLLTFQKCFLECYISKINKANTKQELLNIIYEFRYYNLLPFYKDKLVYEQKQLQNELDKIGKLIIKKAEELKLMEVLYQDEEVNYQIIKNIFTVRIINLENTFLQMKKEGDDIYVQLFDEGGFQEKNILLDVKDYDRKLLNIRLNKKIRVFY